MSRSPASAGSVLQTREHAPHFHDERIGRTWLGHEPVAAGKCRPLQFRGAVMRGQGDDRDNGSPHALAEALPNARFEQVPGTHMSSVTEPALGEAIARFLVG